MAFPRYGLATGMLDEQWLVNQQTPVPSGGGGRGSSTAAGFINPYLKPLGTVNIYNITVPQGIFVRCKPGRLGYDYCPTYHGDPDYLIDAPDHVDPLAAAEVYAAAQQSFHRRRTMFALTDAPNKAQYCLPLVTHVWSEVSVANTGCENLEINSLFTVEAPTLQDSVAQAMTKTNNKADWLKKQPSFLGGLAATKLVGKDVSDRLTHLVNRELTACAKYAEDNDSVMAHGPPGRFSDMLSETAAVGAHAAVNNIVGLVTLCDQLNLIFLQQPEATGIIERAWHAQQNKPLHGRVPEYPSASELASVVGKSKLVQDLYRDSVEYGVEQMHRYHLCTLGKVIRAAFANPENEYGESYCAYDGYIKPGEPMVANMVSFNGFK